MRLCVIKVCEGRGPCSWEQIDWRHVNYRRQATCVTFLSSVCSHIPPFSQVTDSTPLFFFHKTVWDSFCISLSGSLFNSSWSIVLWRECSVSIFLVCMTHSASVCVKGRYSSRLVVEDALACVKSPWAQNCWISLSAAAPSGICDTQTAATVYNSHNIKNQKTALLVVGSNPSGKFYCSEVAISLLNRFSAVLGDVFIGWC